MPLGLAPGDFLHSASAVSGFTGVALGAFGAHGLQAKLAKYPDGALRIANWKTASIYQLAHTLATLVISQRLERHPTRSALPGYLFLLGNVMFSGSIYLLVLDTTKKYTRMLGPVTPLGGLCYLAGWVALLWS